MARIAVLGAGAWGTAIACALSSRLEVALWARDRAQAEEISASRKNDRYLPGIALPTAVQVTSQLERAVSEARLALAATPVAGLRELLEGLPAAQPFVWLCKGFEEGSGSLPHQIAEQTLGKSARCRFRARGGRPAARRAPARVLQRRLGRRRDRRRSEERDGDCRRYFGWSRARAQRARRADHARPCRDRAPGHGARRRARDLHGPRRRGRPDPDRDRRPVAQSPRRARSGARPRAARDPRGPRPRRRGRALGKGGLAPRRRARRRDAGDRCSEQCSRRPPLSWGSGRATARTRFKAGTLMIGNCNQRSAVAYALNQIVLRFRF